MNDLINDNELLVSKYTLIGDNLKIDTNKGSFIIKKNKTENYDFLLSRDFSYLPNLISKNDKYSMYEFIDNIVYDDNLRAIDFIHLLSLMHAKTSYPRQ